MARSQGPEELVAGLDLFAGLSKRQLRSLLNKSREVNHAEGRAVSAEGLGGLAFHLILEGSATVSRGGRDIRSLGAGDHFGEITMIDGRPRSATVTTDGPMKTLAIPHAAFQELLDEDPGFARGLLRTLCTRLRDAEAGPSAD